MTRFSKLSDDEVEEAIRVTKKALAGAKKLLDDVGLGAPTKGLKKVAESIPDLMRGLDRELNDLLTEQSQRRTR